jgi:hypothetical protein
MRSCEESVVKATADVSAVSVSTATCNKSVLHSLDTNNHIMAAAGRGSIGVAASVCEVSV